MSLRFQLEHAAIALLKLRNADGGMPAVQTHHASGAWTTASALHCILSSNLTFSSGLSGVMEMVEFLLQIRVTKRGNDFGSWPLAQGSRGSTMATGHACAALAMARNLFDYDAEIKARIDEAINHGVTWLRNHQNSDGGWGTEPSSGGEGVQSTVLATFYALMPFISLGEKFSRPGTVRDAGIFCNSGDTSETDLGLRKELLLVIRVVLHVLWCVYSALKLAPQAIASRYRLWTSFNLIDRRQQGSGRLRRRHFSIEMLGVISRIIKIHFATS